MKSSSCHKMPSIIFTSMMFFLSFTTVFSITNPEENWQAQLKKINKPFVKSIKSPDGDIIDCVLIHLQPAFDLPQLKGTLPLGPPELPKGHEITGSEVKQLWNSNGESCPNGTIPIRRTTESDLIRFSNMEKSKTPMSQSHPGHKHAVGIARGEEYYGGQGEFNVWAPNVTSEHDFSVSQIWVATDDIPDHPTNTVEAGWMVYRQLNGDNKPRLFIYWTNKGYQPGSGCYNLQCSGFVQTNNKLTLGATITPVSIYNGQQTDFNVLIWKGKRTGNWWLQFGSIVMGYWPASLFPDLRNHATTVQFGGEVYSRETTHTLIEMGSGHFPAEGFTKASFIRHMKWVNGENTLKPMSDVSLYAEKPSCYDVTKGYSKHLGNYIFIGGPGNNPYCP